MNALRIFFLLLLFSSPAEAQWWKVQTSGLDTNLRGVSAIYVPDPNAQGAPVPVVWASGSNGVILKSLDQGKTWKRLHVSEGDELDFRGIVALNARTAYVMSSGEGEKSRIYKTMDGGETWMLQYTDKRKEFFLDSIACDADCVALSDPIDGKFLLLKTTDGEHWQALPSDNMPAALPKEGSFAASNSCLALFGEHIFFVTGGPAARVFHSGDSGRTWTATKTPIAHGNASSGIFSIARPDMEVASVLVVVGGDYQDPKRAFAIAATTAEGKTWKLSPQQPGGFRSAVAALDRLTFFAVGPNGEEMSVDQGAHWKHTDSLNLNAVAILDEHHGWAVGPNGTIAVFVNHLQYNIRHRNPDRSPPSQAFAVAE